MKGYKFLFSKSGVAMYEESDMFFSFPLLEGKLIDNLSYFDLSTKPLSINLPSNKGKLKNISLSSNIVTPDLEKRNLYPFMQAAPTDTKL
jgi:hypothetical protein